MFKRAFLPLNNAEIHIKIGLQMATISPDKQTKETTKTPNFCFSRRRTVADLHQTLH